jgi:hypothetical protein
MGSPEDCRRDDRRGGQAFANFTQLNLLSPDGWKRAPDWVKAAMEQDGLARGPVNCPTQRTCVRPGLHARHTLCKPHES